MEAPVEDSSVRSFSNVEFTDIPRRYPQSEDVTCRYTITSEFQPTSRDWIGVFKVGWRCMSDYNTFVWTDSNTERSNGSTTRKVVFKEYHLPKDGDNSYQFCYVDNTGQVQGVSGPFSFSTLDQSYGSMDDDALVVYTKEQINQTLGGLEELKAERDQVRAENETLSASLRRREEEINALKEQLIQKDMEICDLERRLHLLEEENKQLSCTAELEAESRHLKVKLGEFEELIVMKNQLVADKDNMILLLQRQNKELMSAQEGSHSANCEFPNAPTTEPENTDNAATNETHLPLKESGAECVSGNEEITDDTEEDLECRYCKERFPGITHQQLDQHEISHKVCPFCFHLCDHMDQIAFEDHVYSHN